MKTSTNGRKFIAKEEGNILYAYDDATSKKVNVGDAVKGTLTIGVGHTSAAGSPKVVPGMTITPAQADSILASDLGKVESQVTKLVKVPLNQNQFDALVSFQFNTGGLANSTTLKKLNAGDYQGAADSLLNWSRAVGNPTILLPRRQRERTLFLTKTSSSPAAVGGVVVAGAGAAVAAPHNYLPWIVAGTMAVAVIVFLGYTIHEYRKTLATAPVTP